MKITFLGAVEEVTGSRYLVESEGIKILVDCGMFQGPWELTQRNMDPFPVDPKSIDALILTHAHIDHTGYIPALLKKGFRGKIYCSKGTYALCSLLLVDSGSLQEERMKGEFTRGGPDHPPSVALYTARDAEKSLKFFQPVDYNTVINIGKSLTCTLIRSGHILGSAFVVLSDGKQKLTFSGDLGQPRQSFLKSPPHLKQTDYLVIESTYGNRLHEKNDPLQILSEVINETVAKGGVLIIPCFAVERAQTILYYLYKLKQKQAIANIPIFLDSPMAINITDLLCKFKDEYQVSAFMCRDIFQVSKYTCTSEESKQLDHIKHPGIIISGSGMADGGRVMFHLQHFISDAKNTVLFVGYQAKGTTGSSLVDGAKVIEINGQSYPVHAEIKIINSLSAHADYNEILEWLSYFETSPKKVFITHGEIESARALKAKIEERFGWSVVIPEYLTSFDLG